VLSEVSADAIGLGDAAAAGEAARTYRRHARSQFVPILKWINFYQL
jgi:hypothetical protein